MCNHASPSVLWLCWNKGFSVLFVSSQAKLNNVRSYEWPRHCLQVIMIPSLSRTNSIRSSSIQYYMYVYVHRSTGCNNPPSWIHAIYHRYLPNIATGCIKNTGCSFNYNHNHKYMTYVCINLCSRGDTNTYLHYTRGGKRANMYQRKKWGCCVSCCWVMECA